MCFIYFLSEIQCSIHIALCLSTTNILTYRTMETDLKCEYTMNLIIFIRPFSRVTPNICAEETQRNRCTAQNLPLLHRLLKSY